MSDDARHRLQSEILTAFWRDLKPHAEREALFVVTEELDLVDVGLEIMNDNAELVSAWVQGQQIRRPKPEEVQAWDADPTRSFRSLIVAPYVLLQGIGH